MPQKDVTAPVLGLYLGMSPASVPSRAMVDCLNVRIRQGKVVRDNLGWAPWHDVNLDGRAVTLIETITLRDGTRRTILGNTTDLFLYDNVADEVHYLTPIYVTGTVDVTNGSPNVDGIGTTWTTNAKAGDFIHFGAAGETDQAAIWYEILSVTDDDDLVLTTPYAQATAPGIAYTIRRTFTGDENDVWFTEMFYGGTNFGAGAGPDRWYGTNGVDPVVAWDGALPQVYQPALGDVQTCRSLRRYSNQMIYIAPTTSGEFKAFSIRTSKIGEPEETVADEAQEFIVHDGADELLNAYQLGDSLAIYGRRSVTMAQFVGAPVYYAFRTMNDQSGPLSSRAVAPFPDYHQFIGDDCMYIFDGSRAQETNVHLWRDAVRRIVPDRQVQLHNWFDEANAELQWVVPLTTDTVPDVGFPEKAFTHHYLEQVDTARYGDPYTFRDLPATVFGNYARGESLTFDELPFPFEEYNFRWNDKFFMSNFQQTLFGTSTGDIFILNETASQDGVDPVSFVRFPRVACGDVEWSSTVMRIYPFLEQITGSDQSVTVTLFTTNTLDGTAELAFTGTVDLAMSTSRRFVSPRKPGRYAEVQIGTETGLAYWATSGYRLQSKWAGSR